MTRDRNRAPTLFKVGIRGVRFGRRKVDHHAAVDRGAPRTW